MNSGIYRIRHIDSGRLYVGSAVSLAKRWSEHQRRLRADKHHARPLQNAWNKYGECAFAFEIIEVVEDLNILIEREQFWMDALLSGGRGYNVSPVAGSPRGVKHTADTRAKVSAASSGRTVSAETRAILSAKAKARDITHLRDPKVRAVALAKMRGRPQPEAIKRLVAIRTGMKFPPAWCAAIGAAQRGIKRGTRSDEHRARLSAANTGHIPTEEAKAKMSAAAKLRGPPKLSREAIDRGAAKRTGAKRTPEQRARMRLAHARRADAAD